MRKAQLPKLDGDKREFFFLFDIIQKSILADMDSKTIKVIHYILVLTVLLTGLITLFK